ncbi:MAG: type II toxin-antitoxin system prevent-host-death family antitoxin [Candidatus Sulfotelmatobacter sp.]
MEKAISAADANRKFSRVLREVKEGRSFVVTSHGRPVARIAPVEQKEGRIGESQSWKALIRRLRNQRVINVGRWTREELYERD